MSRPTSQRSSRGASRGASCLLSVFLPVGLLRFLSLPPCRRTSQRLALQQRVRPRRIVRDRGECSVVCAACRHPSRSRSRTSPARGSRKCWAHTRPARRCGRSRWPTLTSAICSSTARRPVDWAVVGYAPGLRDVAYFLGGSVPTDLRREQERRLIARYCERLGADGVMLAIDAAWDQYRVQLVTAWIAAVVTPQWDRSGSRSRSAWAQRCARTRRSRITASPIC